MNNRCCSFQPNYQLTGSGDPRYSPQLGIWAGDRATNKSRTMMDRAGTQHPSNSLNPCSKLNISQFTVSNSMPHYSTLLPQCCFLITSNKFTKAYMEKKDRLLQLFCYYTAYMQAIISSWVRLPQVPARSLPPSATGGAFWAYTKYSAMEK